jgi:lambda family phage portal protein
MGLLGRLLRRNAVTAPSAGDEVSLRARFDAAQTTAENRRHWQFADAKSADAALSADVRKVLRERSRYEVANNSYAAGIVRTIAEDTIGVSPRLQLAIARDDEASLKASQTVEAAFHRWADRIDLGGKLRTMRAARIRDGEVFALMISNPRTREETGISLDLQLVEADQVYSPVVPDLRDGDSFHVDGIILDRFSNPLAYQVADLHPGSELGTGFGTFKRYTAKQVIHYFRADRPGQHRGVPELTPALPLFAQLRRYTLAVLSSAEAAASFAGIIYTDAPPGGEARPVRMLEPISLERQTLMTMPAGWKMSQLSAEQPTTAYADFKGELLDEIGRCLCVPSNLARGNSSAYNYASGRLDHQIYRRAIDVERGVISRMILDRVFEQWWDEAVLLSDIIPARLRRSPVPHSWFWSAAPHVDPAKEAVAAKTRLEAGLTTLADEFASVGKDWQEQMRQRAKEQALAASFGLIAEDDAPDETEDAEDVEDLDEDNE